MNNKKNIEHLKKNITLKNKKQKKQLKKKKKNQKNFTF